MKVYFHTLGCKVNRYETEYMRTELIKIGFSDTFEAKDADLIVVNSCTVTSESDRKTRQLVRRYKRLNENAVVLLTGCMPQAFPKDAQELPADIILGNGSERDVVWAVDTYFKTHTRIVKIDAHKRNEKFPSGGLDNFSERTRAYMKIEDGCDRGCTYCIIPKARGRVRSRSLDEIRNEAMRLAKAGFLEIVLVGINLSSFGADTGLSLADAVETVAGIEGIKRVRLGSLEPDLTDDVLLGRLKKIEQFCPQFHLSLQSGCDETLKRMNRLYSADYYRELVQKIHKIWEDASVTTDIMVGFVGETDTEFQKSLRFAKEMRFLKAHIFPYSIREGTAAANISGHIPENIKAERAALMAKECDFITIDVLNELCGKEREVLFERTEKGYSIGHTKNFTEVFIKETPEVLKTTKTVRIIKPFKSGVLAELSQSV